MPRIIPEVNVGIDENSTKKEGINEAAVESFILVMIAAVSFAVGFFFIPTVFAPFGFVFSVLGIALAVYSLVEMIPYKRFNGLPYAIIAIALGIIVPIVISIVRVVLNMPIQF